MMHSTINSVANSSQSEDTVSQQGQTEHSMDAMLPGLEHNFEQSHPCFRLLVLSSSILPSKRKIAVLDGYTEIHIGRDLGTSHTTPRIRLKEMEVSKLHSTLYWDGARREWAIVDMGSKHGTFVASVSSQVADTSKHPVATEDRFVRLSPARMASIPRTLRHLDKVSIGGTVFQIHIHQSHLPCPNCVSQGEYDIPLFAASKVARSHKRERDLDGGAPEVAQNNASSSRDPKKAMSLLKQSLLTRHSLGTDTVGPTSYIDRSAKRRALHLSSRADSPGISTTTPLSTDLSLVSQPALVQMPVPSRSSMVWSSPPKSPSPSPSPHSATPISESNMGHRLLMKQGWNPGTPLGVTPDPTHVDDIPEEGSVRLLEPLQVTANHGRTGLGMSLIPAAAGTTVIPSTSEWRESSKRRRWDELERSVA